MRRDHYQEARTRRLENALNYVLGYLDALSAYAHNERQRDGAAQLRETICRSLAAAPIRRDDEEETGNIPQGDPANETSAQG